VVVASKLARKMEKNDSLLIANPLLGSIEPVLEKHPLGYRYLMINSIFKEIYYIDKDSIYIVAIWDCRQNPITRHTSRITYFLFPFIINIPHSVTKR